VRTTDLLSIGDVARRSGLAPSALRYYETFGLITSTRTAGDRRRYPRSVLRRLAVIRSAQHVGLTLDQIVVTLADLDPDAAPTKRQWSQISAAWRPLLDQRIDALVAVRDSLDSCIGCGCLSMRQCALYNPQDELGSQGSGPRRKVAVLDEDVD
jgi:MerR family redox-sensitive transcriptional activator SoxR